jgi:hypothetical protein
MSAASRLYLMVMAMCLAISTILQIAWLFSPPANTTSATENQRQRFLQSSSESSPLLSLPQSSDSNGTTYNATTATATNRERLFCSSQVLGEKQAWNYHKKVISYSIFGTSSNMNDTNSTAKTTALPDWVVDGIERNILDAQRYYPDWIVRVYTYDAPQTLVDKWLVHNSSTFHNVEVVECFANTLLAKSNSRKMLSRILAYDDPKVWYSLVRDADSRLSLREVMAVHEFMRLSMAMDNIMPDYLEDHNSKEAIYFHSMHDHDSHVVPIMGGMFGMKRGLLQAAKLSTSKISMKQLLDLALQEYPNDLGGCCGEDQQFLALYLWPQVRKVTLDHAMRPERCQEENKAKECREFPLGPRDESIDYFVGSGFKDQDEKREWHTKRQKHTCTLQCNLINESNWLETA